ncbi:MAG TPA: hypothetical protein VNZ86_08325, partial [Bacteroidia bacterium]|nr:hypothetical protein [Bacteroidia bacterium]
RANNGKEGYELYRRAEQVKLFKDKEKRTADIQKLGDIALDLNATAYAGEIYWLCFSRIKKEDLNGKEMLPYFLYTLDKLGIKDIKNNFKGNFEKEFKKIDKERKKEMERSPVYKSFRKRK